MSRGGVARRRAAAKTLAELAADVLTVSGLKAFFRADIGVSVTFDMAEQWANQSAASISLLTQGTGSKMPAYSATGFNGRPCLNFDGIDDELDGGSFSEWIGSSTGTIYILYRPTAASITNARGDLNHCIVGNVGGFAGLFQRATPDVVPWNYDGTNDTGAAVANTLGAIQIVRWRHAGGNIYARVNATEGAPVASGATTSLAGAVAIGAAGVYSPAIDADYAGVISTDTDVSSPDDAKIMAFLKAYGGLS